MSGFFKHVGMANNKKVIIVQRQIPGEEHMAAVLYSDILPTRYHDDIMAVLESPEGQAAYEFKDILQRRMMANGDNMLQALSGENFIKRVAQNAIIVKPNSKSSIRLDELVKILNEVGRGDQAVRRLDEMDKQLGMNNNPAMTNAQRNKDKMAVEENMGESMYYPSASAAAPAPAADPNAMIVQLTQMAAQLLEQARKISDQNTPATPAKPKRTAKKKTTV